MLADVIAIVAGVIATLLHATAKELTRIIKPLVGGSSHHVQNNQDFLQSIEDIQLKPDEEMMSFDVEALFTSVPVEPSIDIIKKFLEEDRTATSKNQHDSR